MRAALLTSRRLPLGQGTDAELLAYVRWAQTFGGESIPQLTSATATAAISYFLATDEHWRRHKSANASSAETDSNLDDTDEIVIPQLSEAPAQPATRNSPGRRPKDSQSAPLAFMPADLVRTRSFHIPLRFANELESYVAWLAQEHNLASAVVTALVVDRAFREFLRLDTAWQKYRQTGGPSRCDSG